MSDQPFIVETAPLEKALDPIPSLMARMNISYRGTLMASDISWCRVVGSADESLSTSMHSHLCNELHYIYEGELSFEFESQTYLCEAGQWILIPAGCNHTLHEQPTPTRKLVIGFEVNSENELVSAVYSTKNGHPLLRTASPSFQALAEALLQKTITAASVSLAGIVHALLLELADSCNEDIALFEDSLRSTEDSQRVLRILSFINENTANNMTVDDLANALGLSVRQTARICQRLFGCSVSKLAAQVRIKSICRVLANSKHSIADVSEIFGFSSPYAFSRYFSHYTGVTPSAYRRNYEVRTAKKQSRLTSRSISLNSFLSSLET